MSTTTGVHADTLRGCVSGSIAMKSLMISVPSLSQISVQAMMMLILYSRDKTFENTASSRTMSLSWISIHPQKDVDQSGRRARLLLEQIRQLLHESYKPVSSGAHHTCRAYLPTFHNLILRSRSALKFLANLQESSSTPMKRNKCSAGIVLYTSSFCNNSCVVSISRSCRTHLTMICLKIRLWSEYVNEGGREGVEEAGSSGAGATNFWNGAAEPLHQHTSS